MRINDQNLAGISSSPAGQTHETESVNRQGRGGGTGAGAVSGDQVTLSNLAGSLRELSAEAPERAAYLERLAMRVHSGGYQLDAVTLSRSLINDALQFRG